MRKEDLVVPKVEHWGTLSTVSSRGNEGESRVPSRLLTQKAADA